MPKYCPDLDVEGRRASYDDMTACRIWGSKMGKGLSGGALVVHLSWHNFKHSAIRQCESGRHQAAHSHGVQIFC